MPVFNNMLAGASGGAGGAGGYEIERSLRFNSSDSAHLSRTPSSAGNRRTWTWSGWVKRSNLGVRQSIFSAGSDGTDLHFQTTDKLHFYYYSGGYVGWCITDAVYRDVSAWYHIVLAVDTTQSTSSDRCKIYVNNVRQEVTFSSTFALNSDLDVNNNVAHYIGRYSNSNNYFGDYYLADTHQIDGQALAPTDFGKTDNNGVWQPIAYAGTYGTNGFHLDFADNSSSAALGTDTSGNSNTWTVNNLSVAAGAGNDSLRDSPSQIADQTDSGAGGEVVGNYATWNPVNSNTHSAYYTLSNGNLKCVAVGGQNQSSGNRGFCVSTIGMSSGKYYFELTVDLNDNNDHAVGIAKAAATGYYSTAGNWTYQATGQKFANSGGGNSYGASYTVGDIIGVAFDADTGALVCYKNGSSQGTLATVTVGETYFFVWAIDAGTAQDYEVSANFGQRAFAYTAPTGFKSLNTANLPEPTIADGSKYFDTKLYPGTGASNAITMTNSALSPDFVWIKNRNGSYNHLLFDAVRGATNYLESNSNNQEQSSSQSLTSFDSNGFTLGTNVHVNRGTGYEYAAWAWDAGANSDKTYTVTVSGGDFYIDGAQQPTLTLAEGSTYKFDQSDSTNATHPLRFSLSNDGTHGGGTEYTTGVTTVGTPGSAGAYTQIVIASPAPTLYAYCTNHSGMGFQVNTSANAGYTIPAGAHNDTYYDRSKSWISLVTTSSLESAYNSYSATSKLGAFDGKRSTALYGVGNQALTITFDASAFPASGGPYIVEVENNQRAVTLNGSQTGTPWPLQATGWQKFDPVSTITSISSAAASASYGGMINRIRVNGKVLADPTATPDNVPSVSTQVLASPESGFSISKWAGTGSEATVAHGLNSAPLFYFAKSLDNAESWDGITTVLPSNALDNATLDGYAAFSVSYHEVPTSLYIGRPSADSNNENMIAYNFAPVEGFSAMGVHTNGGSNCQDFIYTGFRPAWILARAQIAEWWHIFDSKRNTSNPMTQKLWPNEPNAEAPQDGFDFLSNGFRVIAADNAFFASGVNYTWVWMAFAEHPFKNARAR